MRVLYVVQLFWALYDKVQRKRYVLLGGGGSPSGLQGHIAKLVTSSWNILGLAAGRPADSHIVIVRRVLNLRILSNVSQNLAINL